MSKFGRGSDGRILRNYAPHGGPTRTVLGLVKDGSVVDARDVSEACGCTYKTAAVTLYHLEAARKIRRVAWGKYSRR